MGFTLGCAAWVRGGYGSESEAEDEASHVRLPQDIGRGNRAAHQSAVQLHELGPRLTLELVKVEEGLLSGAVMFHQYGPSYTPACFCPFYHCFSLLLILCMRFWVRLIGG